MTTGLHGHCTTTGSALHELGALATLHVSPGLVNPLDLPAQIHDPACPLLILHDPAGCLKSAEAYVAHICIALKYPSVPVLSSLVGLLVCPVPACSLPSTLSSSF